MKIARIYTKSVKDNFTVLFANWEPATTRRLGDFGILDGNIFIHQGNISQFKIPITTRRLNTGDHKTFSSAQGVNISFNPKGTVVAGNAIANANLDIQFSKEHAVFFSAADCSTSMIDNKPSVGATILSLYNTGKWEEEWVVIMDLVKSKRTTIAISLSKQSSILFEAESPSIANIDLANASIGLGVTREKDIGYKVEAKRGLIPLIGLSKIQRRGIFKKGKQVRPLVRKAGLMGPGGGGFAFLTNEDIGAKEDFYFDTLQ